MVLWWVVDGEWEKNIAEERYVLSFLRVYK